MTAKVSAPRHRDGALARAFKALARVVNPALVPLAGSAIVPLWGVVRHRGRRSGRRYSTPVAVIATRDAFFIPLPYGPDTDWCRNLRAGGGGLRWSGRDYAVGDLVVVDRDAVPLGPILGALVRAFGISQFLRAPRSPA
jgi:hypothetical protein